MPKGISTVPSMPPPRNSSMAMLISGGWKFGASPILPTPSIQTVKSCRMLESRRLLIYFSGHAEARPILVGPSGLAGSMGLIVVSVTALAVARDRPRELLDEVHVVLR